MADIARSPCIDVCQIDQASGLCRGCYRTLDEIASWSVMTTTERLMVLSAVETRRESASP